MKNGFGNKSAQTSEKENKQYSSCLFYFCSTLKTESFVFTFWAVISFIAVYALMLDEQMVNLLAEANKSVQMKFIVFSKINSRVFFNTNLANAHFFLMCMFIPIQLFMLFSVPNAGIAPLAQKRGRNGLLWGIFLFSSLLAIILMIGPVISTRYTRIFGEGPMIALSDFAISIGFSYLIRIISIVLVQERS